MSAHPEWRRMYRCPVCPMEFRTLTGKKHHIKEQHPKPAKLAKP